MILTQQLDQPDNTELIRSRIAELLATNFTGQQAIATGNAIDPAPWDIRVFEARSVPIGDYQDATDMRPMVTVFYDRSAINWALSEPVRESRYASTFNIDVYAAARSAQTDGGQAAGDKVAALEAQRVGGLVRKILMAGPHTLLGFPDRVADQVVFGRKISDIQLFQPEQDGRPLTHVVAERLQLDVEHNEYSPQYEPQTLEYVGLTINRADSGELLVATDFDLTT